MTVNYNATGTRRKELVKKVSEALGGWKVKYLGAPTFSYRVGDFEINRDGVGLSNICYKVKPKF